MIYFTIFTAILSLFGISSVVLSVVVYIQGKRTQMSILFSLMCLSITLWVGATLWMHYANVFESLSQAFVSEISSFITGATIFLFFLLFSFVFPEEDRRLKLSEIAISVVPYIFITAIIVLYPHLLFKEVSINPATYLIGVEWATLGYTLYSVFIVVYLVAGIFNLIKRYKRTIDKVKRAQIFYVLLGTAFGGIIGALFSLLLPFLSFFTVPEFYNDFFRDFGQITGSLGTFILVVFTFYAITKHHLFSAKVIATELLIFSIWAFLLIRLFVNPTLEGILINGALLVLVVFFGGFLIKSVLSEVNQREELERVSTKLKDLQGNLETKVKEQTVEIEKAYEVEKKARVELEELDKAKDQFILTTQHHLRTPLTIIKGHIDILKGKLSLPEEAKNVVGQMIKSTDTISKSVNNLLQTTEMKVRK